MDPGGFTGRQRSFSFWPELTLPCHVFIKVAKPRVETAVSHYNPPPHPRGHTPSPAEWPGEGRGTVGAPVPRGGEAESDILPTPALARVTEWFPVTLQVRSFRPSLHCGSQKHSTT